MDDDPHDLQRFVEAQARIYDGALAELRAGRKTSHWMWFIFPQAAGLGASPMAQRYAIASLDEAQAYLSHPVLGPRLMACVEAVNALDGLSAEAIFGDIDAMKLRSSLTLFAAAAPGARGFRTALAKYFGGGPDARTLKLLELSALP
ncbi:MAG TPA: DUF1810 domain-containing protein [Caulobacteraceae bacterium]|nr:DUF1810 domain-containing protein [Caulobacteraceae bacterium]